MNKYTRDRQNSSKSTINVSAKVKQAWGPEYVKPDVAYEFSNGRKFLSSDKSSSGIYDGT